MRPGRQDMPSRVVAVEAFDMMFETDRPHESSIGHRGDTEESSSSGLPARYTNDPRYRFVLKVA
jgi:hypothetical protein